MTSCRYCASALLILALLLGGCTGLQQFPEVSENYTAELGNDDPDYAVALAKIRAADGTAVDEAVKKSVRNDFIETRLAVIDSNFQEFQIALSRENVQVDFLVDVAAIGVGSAGALVSETTSQILSAVSGGLAGSKAAYSKAALYEKALSALLAQMIASRKIVLARIYERRQQNYADYWLSDAKNDLDAYLFAGSLPGAIVATSADATVKNARADALLFPKITKAAVTEEAFADRQALTQAIAGLDGADSKALVTKIEEAFPVVASFVALQYPDDVRAADSDGSKAKKLLGRLVVLTAKEPEDRTSWKAAINSL